MNFYDLMELDAQADDTLRWIEHLLDLQHEDEVEQELLEAEVATYGMRYYA